MNIQEIIQMGILFVMTGGLISSIIFSGMQMRSLKEQMKLGFFSEFTTKYQNIILNFPPNINSADFDYDELDDETKDETIRYMRVYFNLCSEEYYLWKSKAVDENVWTNWKKGIQFSMSKLAYQKAWIELKKDTIYNREFIAFVEAPLETNHEWKRLNKIM